MLWYIKKRQTGKTTSDYTLGIDNAQDIQLEKEIPRIEQFLACLKNYNFTRSKKNTDFRHNRETEQAIKLEDINYLVINPSTTCNLDCWYCYAREYRGKTQTNLSITEIKEIIHQFLESRKGKKELKPLVISTCYASEVTVQFEEFLELKQIINEQKALFDDEDTYLLVPSTNFYDPPKGFFNFVNEYGFLVVSVDLTNKQQIERILHNLKKIKPNVIKSLIIPLQPQFSSFKAIYERFSNYFDEISFRPVRISQDGKYKWDKLALTSLQKELYRFVLEISDLPENELLDFLLKLGSTDYFRRFLEKILSRTKTLNRCPAGRTAICVSPEKKFYPCTGLMGIADFEMGNLDKETLHLTFPSLFAKLAKTETCYQCPISSWCGGHCVDWVIKEHGREGVSSFTSECYINIAFIKSVMLFIALVSSNYPNLLQNYCKKRGKRYRLNYKLNLTEFCQFFGSI